MYEIEFCFYVNSVKGISVSNHTFLQVAENLSKKGPLILLKEGAPMFSQYLADNTGELLDQSSLTFVLSDYVDLELDEEDYILNKLKATTIGFGTQSYLASHCIVFLLMEWRRFKKRKKS